MQAGLFLSHSRIHGFGDRELYKFADDVLRICRDYIRLRYRLLPYLYGTAMDCVARSLPMARALVLEFQDDPNTWRIGDQCLLGDACWWRRSTSRATAAASICPPARGPTGGRAIGCRAGAGST